MADNEISILAEIDSLEERIAELPIGYISKKTIRGKLKYYHQWMENGKLKSKYIGDDALPELQKGIEERRELQTRLKELKKSVKLPTKSPSASYETNAVVGSALVALSKGVMSWEKRDCYKQLRDYLYSNATDRVCLVFGLRRTGKTTMLRQAIGEMTPEQVSRAVYIKATTSDTMAAMNRDLAKLSERGYQFVFIDEVTLMSDFIDSAALFSDIYAAQGMKIVLSGTDSLGFWFALHQELYDRAMMIHTTFIPFREHSRLLGIDDVDEYIRYGGTLRAGELSFDDPELNTEEASFRDNESARRYIDSAICKNIQHSLACCEDGGHFRHLRTLYEKGELTGAINRIIEDMNHSFVLSVLTRDFESHDLRLAARNLRNEKDEEKRTDVLDRLDLTSVTRQLMKLLEIRNKEEQKIGITGAHIAEIKEYLTALDLIADCPMETVVKGAEPLEHIIFTQPGMRYCQAQALVYYLMKDEEFFALSEFEKKTVAERILEEVRGRMMEEIILLETAKALPSRYRVFKLQFAAGEFDMVVFDGEENACRIYEVKHSEIIVPEQYRHLLDKEKCEAAERRFGDIAGKYVLYRGPSGETENSVTYLNCADYLRSLPGVY